MTTLKIGDPAPAFTLPNDEGSTTALADLRGKNVLIFFFPKAFTGG